MNKGRRSGLKIMSSLIYLIRPLLHVMLLAVVLGVLGFLCAIFLSILGSRFLLAELAANSSVLSAFRLDLSFGVMVAILLALAVLRGVLHYGEQYCNHFLAFKLLAILRHKVFAQLRRLCPAKLEGRDRGNLISLITTDIELLEVFYAHTISPIMIAVLTSLVMLVFLAFQSWEAMLLALVAYGVVGLMIPLLNGRKGALQGLAFRETFGELNTYVLDSLRGLDETLQFGQGEERSKGLEQKSRALGVYQKRLSSLEGWQRAATLAVLLFFSLAMLFLCLALQDAGRMDQEGVLICTVTLMGSFGPVVALSNLSNHLHQTLASGERLLNLLEEKPEVEEVFGAADLTFSDFNLEHVDFAYEDEVILDDYSLKLPRGGILGIWGTSGSGKSTLLKLLMRFWDVQEGVVQVSGRPIQTVNTADLRSLEAFMTQETYLFQDTIAANIALAKADATQEEIEEAARKAALHDWIQTLPQGYETQVAELGDSLSGGERQRIGIARMFLSSAEVYLLDEPTSNLDALNEGHILKSLQEATQDKTLVLVSHRRSTLGIADQVLEMKKDRAS